MTARAWRRIVDETATEFGCTTELTKGGHIKLEHPSGWFVIASGSPSDARAEQNLRSTLRRRGGAVAR